jgi:hypothetical protein
MNLDNVNKAIAVMERVRARGDNFDLRSWQDARSEYLVQTNEEALHTCGTSACFAGWLAVSPEFQADGGEVGPGGRPLLREYRSSRAVMAWLEIDRGMALDLCGCGDDRVYGKTDSRSVTVYDVLAALYRLRDTGSPYPEELAQ